MEKKPKIWFDCDGVLLDWTRPFLENHCSAGVIQYDDLDDIDLSLLYSNPDQFKLDMYCFHQSEDFKVLPALVDKQALEMLKLAGYELHVITQIESEGIARQSRIYNLAFRYGDIFERVHFTVKGESKLEYVRRNEGSGSKWIIIEDNPQFLKEASLEIESAIENARYCSDQLYLDDDTYDYRFHRLYYEGLKDNTIHSTSLFYGVVHPYNYNAIKDIPHIKKCGNVGAAIRNIIERTYE